MTRSTSRISKAFFAGASAVLLLGACQAGQTPPDKTALASATPDLRQGKQLSEVCFKRDIRDWRPLDNHSVIVQRGIKDEYKLDLLGPCDPTNAFFKIGIKSFAGFDSCLSTGDKILTDEHPNMGSCVVTRIYEWHKDANKPGQGAAAASAASTPAPTTPVPATPAPGG